MKYRLLSLVLVGVLCLSACGKGETPADSSQAEATSDTASSTGVASSSPSVSSSPSSPPPPGHHQPTVEPKLDKITDEDKERARKTAEEGIKIYFSGGEYKEWSEKLFPYLAPDVQNTIGEDFNPENIKTEVTKVELLEGDSIITPTNVYSRRVVVETGRGKFYLWMHRNTDRPEKWFIASIKDVIGYEMDLKAKERRDEQRGRKKK